MPGKFARTLDIDAVLREERSHLGLGGTPSGAPEPPQALCLSGGGIRSATFCLGVLQGLAQRGGLRRFHYLSTVSGGGYIGSWLSAWVARAGLDEVEKQLMGGQGCEEPQAVRRLRAYTNYLSPVWGLSMDMLALVAIFLRNLLLHWLVLLPLLTALLMLPRLQLALVSAGGNPLGARWCAGAAFTLLVVTIAYMASDLPGPPPPELVGPPRPPSRLRKPVRRDRFIVGCFVPLLVCAVLLSWLLAWDQALLKDHPFLVVGAGAVAHLAGVGLGALCRKLRGMEPRMPGRQWPAVLAIVVSGALGGWVLHVLAAWLPDPATLNARALHAIVIVPALLGAFWLGITTYAGLMRHFTEEEDREWWARAGGWWLGAAALWALVYLLVLELPRGLLGLELLQRPAGAGAASLGAALLGGLTAAIGFWSRSGPGIEKQVKGVLAVLGSRALEAAAVAFTLLLAVLLSYAASCVLRMADEPLRCYAAAQSRDADRLKQAWVKPAEPRPGRTDPAHANWGRPEHAPLAVKALVAYETVLERASAWHVLLWTAVLSGWAWLASLALGANTFSLHSLYANRLVRAYLGASRDQRRPHHFSGFDADDNLPLKSLRQRHPAGRRLFPVINVALNLTRPAGDRLEWQERKAASFTMSPLHCGSEALRGTSRGSEPAGFVRTARYGAPRRGLSLGRAFSISGAAASPHMGYHSSPFVAFVMTVFNVRLGWWSANPRPAFRKHWAKREPADAFQALFSEIRGASDGEGSFVYLSDGGHFENLGVYEMIRRRCRRLVVVDATCDPRLAFGDLQRAIGKARVDFCAEIEFAPALAEQLKGRHHALATVHYPDGAKGSLLYIKPVLTGDEPLDVKAYAASHAAPESPFPHQKTSEQFFDQSQFEAYRMLGLHSVLQAIPEYRAWPDQAVLAGSGTAAAGAPPAGPKPPLPAAADGAPSNAWLWTGIAGLGGALAITGTVALKDGASVALQQPAVVELKQGATVDLVDRSASGASPPAAFIAVDELRQRVELLSQRVHSESQVLVNQNGAAVDLKKLEQSVANAEARLLEIQEALDAVNMQLSQGHADQRQAAEALNGAVWRLQRELEAGQPVARPAPR